MNNVPLGKIIGEPNATYHSTDAVSNSRLKVFRERPIKYRMMYLDKTLARKTSPAFDIGIAFHARCEGNRAFNRVAVVNDLFKDFRTDEAQEWRTKHQLAGRTVIDARCYSDIHRMVHNFKLNPTVMALLRNTEREVTWRARVGNYLLQCRTDRWAEKARHVPGLGFVGNYAVDFKTVPHLEDWTYHINEFGYHLQDEFYRQVIGLVKGATSGTPEWPRFFFAVTEKEVPWCTEVYQIDFDTQQVARKRVVQDLTELHACYESGVFPGQRNGVMSTGLKSWNLREEQRALGISTQRLTL